ncbi:MAG TPA: L-lactate dehydrogenase [Humisphaera sp.]|jgi:L-lactate dehydrogenase|nr:L-lactate dehydrogenase [Humisphaera sp.]
MPIASNHKIAIVGAGNVGATIAYACLVQGIGPNLALFDMDRARVEAQALDLNHGLQFVPSASVEGSDDPAICADADVIVVTAGAKQKPGQSRLDLAAANVHMCRDLIPKLLRAAPQAILLLVTNPVDVITYVALKLSGRSATTVFGSGTVLDSSRLRFLIAQRCRVAVANVHAHIVGEHGDSEVPLWSSATIGGVPLHQWAVAGHGKPSVQDRAEILQNVKQSAYRIIEGKGATSYAIGLATAHILAAILRDESRVMPVSALLNDYHGISDVCLSVPRLVNRSGVEAPLAVPMNEAEVLGLKNSAEEVRGVIRSLGF